MEIFWPLVCVVLNFILSIWHFLDDNKDAGIGWFVATLWCLWYFILRGSM